MRLAIAAVLGLLLMLPDNSVFAAAQPVAMVARVHGSVWLKKPGNDARYPLQRGGEYHVGDVVSTAADGMLQLAFADGVYIVLGKNTEVRVNQYAFDELARRRTARIRMLKGKMRVVLYKVLEGGSRFEVETAHAVLTPAMLADFVVDAGSGETLAAVLDGSMVIKSALNYVIGTARLGVNLKSVVKAKLPPELPDILRENERAAYLNEFMMHDKAGF